MRGCTDRRSFDLDCLRSSAAQSLCVPATRHFPYAHRRNGRRKTPTRLPVVAQYYLGEEPTHLSPFTPWDTRPRILQLSLRLTPDIVGLWYFRRHHAATTSTSTTAASDHAAMAVNAEQSIQPNVSTNLFTACATHAIHGVSASPDSCVSNLVQVGIDSSQDLDRSRSKTNVPIRRREPNSQADGNRRFVTLPVNFWTWLIDHSEIWRRKEVCLGSIVEAGRALLMDGIVRCQRSSAIRRSIYHKMMAVDHRQNDRKDDPRTLRKLLQYGQRIR